MLLMKTGNNLLKPKDGKPGKMYRMINTCNYRNSARIITRTAFKKPSIFIEKCLFTKYLRIGTRIQDTKNMLNMINDLNRNWNLQENCLLVVGNKMGIESLKNISLSRKSNIPLAEYFIEALCLSYVWILTTQFLTTNIIYR